LSESMRYLSTGMWWLAFFPGLLLLVVVRGFDILGDNLRMLYDHRKNIKSGILTSHFRLLTSHSKVFQPTDFRLVRWP